MAALAILKGTIAMVRTKTAKDTAHSSHVGSVLRVATDNPLLVRSAIALVADNGRAIREVACAKG